MTLEYVTIKPYKSFKQMIKRELDEVTQDYNARNIFFYLTLAFCIPRWWYIALICLLATLFFWLRAIRRSGEDIAYFRKRYFMRVREERKKRILEAKEKNLEKQRGLET